MLHLKVFQGKYLYICILIYILLYICFIAFALSIYILYLYNALIVQRKKIYPLS